MDATLGWIGDIFRQFLDLFPHLVIVEATHRGVKFVHGHKIKKMNAGMHWYWPVVTKIVVAPIKRQTTNLCTQYLVTSDKVTVGCAGILVYEVSDIVKLLTECWDYEETVQDMCLAAIKDVIVLNDYHSLVGADAVDIEEELEEQLTPELEHFGIKVIRFTLSDLAPARVLAHLGIANE